MKKIILLIAIALCTGAWEVPPIEKYLGASHDGKVVHKFGWTPAAKTAPSVVWDDGRQNYDFYPLSAVMLAVSSTSVEDADYVTATGVRSVNIQGLDDNLRSQQETVSLLGPTPVPLVNKYRRIFRMKAVGSNEYLVDGAGFNAGTIRCSDASDGVTAAVVTAGNNQTLMAVYTVPIEFDGHMYQVYGGSDDAQFSIVRLWARPVSETWQLKHIFNTNETIEHHNYIIPNRFTGGTDIRITAKSSNAGSTIEGGFTLLLEPN